MWTANIGRKTATVDVETGELLDEDGDEDGYPAVASERLNPISGRSGVAPGVFLASP